MREYYTHHSLLEDFLNLQRMPHMKKLFAFRSKAGTPQYLERKSSMLGPVLGPMFSLYRKCLEQTFLRRKKFFEKKAYKHNNAFHTHFIRKILVNKFIHTQS